MNDKAKLGIFIGILAIGAMSLIPMYTSATTTQTRESRGMNGQGNGLEIKAEALNITTDQLKEKLGTKTLLEVATELGISADQLHEKIQASSKQHWQEMGLSEEEIKERTAAQEQRQADCDGSGNHQGGFGGRNMVNS